MNVESSLASQLYATSRQLTGTGGLSASADTEKGQEFSAALENALRDMKTTIDQGEQAAFNAMSGAGDVQSVVEALSATELALETAVVVRDKVVEAYQEIMRMPV